MPLEMPEKDNTFVLKVSLTCPTEPRATPATSLVGSTVRPSYGE